MERAYDQLFIKEVHIVEFDKTVYAAFMHYVKTGEHCFTNHPEDALFKVIEDKVPFPVHGAPNASLQVSFVYFA
jgi:hypothetical protein